MMYDEFLTNPTRECEPVAELDTFALLHKPLAVDQVLVAGLSRGKVDEAFGAAVRMILSNVELQ